ncbi:MAG: hypothetical protein MI975_23940 [Cytophagales bacterium]|nr:hypothetical protein [Cytophagales bacterium]
MGGKRKSLEKKKPDVSKELEGLDIAINSLGEIQSTYDVDKINEFLDIHVEDKKLKNKGFSEEEDNL